MQDDHRSFEGRRAASFTVCCALYLIAPFSIVRDLVATQQSTARHCSKR
jgi:hypothetical protein